MPRVMALNNCAWQITGTAALRGATRGGTGSNVSHTLILRDRVNTRSPSAFILLTC